MDRNNRHTSGNFWGSPSKIALVIFLMVAGFFLWTEHQAHLVGALPLLLILGLCGGMHFFMHGSHGGSHHGGDRERDETPPRGEM